MTNLENKTVIVTKTTSKTDVLNLNNKEFNLGKVEKLLGDSIFFENKTFNGNEYYVMFSENRISLQPRKNNLKTIHITDFEIKA